jgi:hypothetical protein
VKVSGDGQTARSGQTLASPIVVVVRDAAGTPLALVPVSLTLYNGGFVSPTSAFTGVDGQASVSWSLSTNSGTTLRTDSVSVSVGALAPIKFYATVRPALRIRWVRGGASQSNPVQIDTTGATLRDTLVVQVFDPTGGAQLGSGGQTVTWSTVAPASTDGVAVNSVVMTDNNGFAKNVWMLRDPNTGNGVLPSSIAKRMKAVAAGIGEVEFRASAIPGRVMDLSRTSFYGTFTTTANLTTIAGSTVSATLTLMDARGNPRAGDTVTFVVQGGGASVQKYTDAAGAASITWVAKTTLGVDAVNASVISNVVTDSNTIRDAFNVAPLSYTVVGGPPASVVAISPLNQGTATVGSTLGAPITVEARDVYGNISAGYSVSFAVAGGGGSVSPASATTGVNGRASTLWTLGTVAGANTLTASAGGDTKIFTATGLVGPATTIAKISGDGQSATAGSTLAPITVEVRDAFGNPVQDLVNNVVFTIISSSGAGSTIQVGAGVPATTLNVLGGADGRATVLWKIGAAAGSNALQVSFKGVTLVFSATGTP